MLPIKIVQILPHLIPLYVFTNRVGLYAKSYSPQLLKYLDGAEYVQGSEIMFSNLKQQLATVADYNGGELQLGQYQIRGDVINMWLPGYTNPIRAEFFGEQLDNLTSYDIITGRTTVKQTGVILPSTQLDKDDALSVVINPELDYSTPHLLVTSLPELQDTQHGSANVQQIPTDYTYPQLFWGKLQLLNVEVERLTSLGYAVTLVTRHVDRLPKQLSQFAIQPSQLDYALSAGYVSVQHKTAVYTDREIFGTIYLGQSLETDNAATRLLNQFAGEITPGDLVVHQDHGVGTYSGMTQEMAGGIMLEYLDIRYADNDQLLVPVSQLHKLTRYIGSEGSKPKLTKLSGRVWESETKKVKKSVIVLAKELVEHFARRELASGPKVNTGDSPEYRQFVAEFPYTETQDQLRSINEVILDLEQTTPMNRLLIGDVGFGKTEVIMRAAFKMVESGYQVAVLCPTTVLAAQHSAVFTNRMAKYGIKVVSLSRFNTAKENKQLVDLLNQGKADIAIGTHRLISKDVKFAKLGLLVVDEEQRFGVRQKERIKQLNYGVHHLAVSATPIPRTMGMALSGIQDISIMAMPPVGRKPIKTELVKNDWNTIVSAIQHEISSGGQVYFVHNEVTSLPSVKAKLESLLPEVKIVIAHGQMNPAQLDKAMASFYAQRAQILLCTTIIENGLDLPNVNTIIINKAHQFGLAQLYQLRGRVGRSGKQATCVLFYQGRDLDAAAAQAKEQEQELKKYLTRLQSIIDTSELGSGFHLASRDLEIRGAGNILGQKQSGHISQIGYALYMQLLHSEVERLKQLVSLPRAEYITL